jgi:phage shock protein PspC (stress-responsive transcriptional regulator)
MMLIMTNLAGKKLERPLEGRWVAGVAAGLADYFGLDVGLVRVVLVVLALVGALGAVIYVAAWVLVPEEGEQASIAEKIISKDGT